jgi:hypothetical protein
MCNLRVYCIEKNEIYGNVNAGRCLTFIGQICIVAEDLEGQMKNDPKNTKS